MWSRSAVDTAVVDPVGTAKGVGSLVDHIPGVDLPHDVDDVAKRMGTGEGMFDAVTDHLDEDGEYLKGVGPAAVAPMVESGKKGKWGDVTGQSLSQLAVLGGGIATESSAGKLSDIAAAADVEMPAIEPAPVAESETSLGATEPNKQPTYQKPTIEAQGKALVPLNRNRNRVKLRSPSQQVEVDLAGDSHAGVPTPHTKVAPRNFEAPPELGVKYQAKGADTLPSSQTDIRMVRRYLERSSK